MFWFWLILLWFCFGFGHQNQKDYDFVLFWLTKIKMMGQFCFVLFCICRCLMSLLELRVCPWLTPRSKNGGGQGFCAMTSEIKNTTTKRWGLKKVASFIATFFERLYGILHHKNKIFTPIIRFSLLQDILERLLKPIKTSPSII